MHKFCPASDVTRKVALAHCVHTLLGQVVQFCTHDLQTRLDVSVHGLSSNVDVPHVVQLAQTVFALVEQLLCMNCELEHDEQFEQMRSVVGVGARISNCTEEQVDTRKQLV